jgi:IS30 family transposase
VCLLLPRGGIPPAARRRSRLALTLAEREDISRGVADLLSGAKNSYIATRVERHSRFAMLIKVPSKETGAVVALR